MLGTRSYYLDKNRRPCYNNYLFNYAYRVVLLFSFTKYSALTCTLLNSHMVQVLRGGVETGY